MLIKRHADILMKNTTILTTITAGLAVITTLALSSCGTSDPEYKAWKAQQKAKADNNPYGVPQAGGETGTYQPEGTSAPYQPLPGVNPEPSPQPPLPSDPGASVFSSGGGSTAPAAGGTSYTVVAGDSLWKLAKKHNTTVEAIQTANGLSDSNIRIGQTLIIPGR